MNKNQFAIVKILTQFHSSIQYIQYKNNNKFQISLYVQEQELINAQRTLYSLRIRVILRQIQIIFCSFFDLLNSPSVAKIIIKFKTRN